MKKQILPPARYALLTACLLSGFAQAQRINFTGDTNPSGSLGASHSTTGVVVGNSSTGTLSIQDGGQLRSEAGMIAQQAGSNGAVVVEGANSSWEVAAPGQTRLTVGDGGSATLQVRNGAKVSSSSQLMSSYTQGSSSLIEIDGANSALTSETCAFGKASTLRISDGGLLYCRAGSEMAAGTVTLSGAGSKWAVDQVLGLGDGQPTSTTVVTLGEGTVLASRDIAMGYGNDSVIINIEGTTTPGAILAEDIAFTNRSVINLNHSDTSGNYVLGGIIHQGYGTINVNQAGTTSLTGDNSYEGLTNVRAGVLRAGAASGFSYQSDFVVAPGATLDTATFSPTIQSLDNGGTVTLAAGGTSGVLTVTRNYIGNGGVIVLNTALGADDAATEMLVVQGNTSGNTTLNISNLGGTGAATTSDGIMVVQVNGASNGSFSLPAPGYVVAGGYRYTLAKVGNNWYLQSDAHVEASGPEASVVCTPAELSDTANQVATCTVTLTAAPTADLPINLVLPAANPRYTTTCASPMVVAANATQASCTITATPNTTAGDGDVSLELAIAPPTTADAYTPAGPAAQVLIKDAGDTSLPPVTGTPTPVPTLGSWGLAALAALMAALGLRRSRKTA